ncbi:MAG: hypothetical protein RI988_3978, partial [Pseudomonadota bacterium]
MLSNTTAPSVLHLAWRTALRDLRAGELRLLLVAVLLAVAALTAVGFFADRLNAGLARDARQLLGGDAVVSSDRATPPQLLALARQLGLGTAETVSFPSMGRAPDARGGETRLVSVKAVSAQYPLRGRLEVRDAADGPARKVAEAPAPGTVWVDPPLLEALNLGLGDELWLGDVALRITRLILIEPDRGAGFIGFAPRVMLSLEDLPRTGLVQPASRVTWRLAVAAPPGKEAAVPRFVKSAEGEIQASGLRGVRVESLEAGRPEMRQTLDRAEKFLNLVALLAALLAAVAVAIAARDFAQRHLDDCAMLRVLGAPQRAIAGAYALEFAAVGLLASAAGVVFGFGVHFAFVSLLGGLIDAQLPLPGWQPAAFGLGVGMTLLAAFGLPPVLQL